MVLSQMEKSIMFTEHNPERFSTNSSCPADLKSLIIGMKAACVYEMQISEFMSLFLIRDQIKLEIGGFDEVTI